MEVHNDASGSGNFIELGVQRISPSTGKKFYKPVVDISITPVLGMMFNSIDQAYMFYLKYARSSGFGVRKHTSYTSGGICRTKYLVCAKEGFKNGAVYSTLDDQDKGKKRRRSSQRIGCGACFKIRYNDIKKYELYEFVEEHNHSFVREEDMQFLRSSRKVGYVKESEIQALSNINLGPVRAFNILKSLCGGYEVLGATKNDFKNFKRDVNAYIGEYDVEMVINRLAKKKQHCPHFSFEYILKEDCSLAALFWADEDAKNNYLVFGDVVGFDATYRSNKYDMVFVPFTGIDNHNRNINLGAAVLGSETADTYSWLLRCYVKTFGSAPKVFVTDQDAAMKKAIRDVVPNTRHRLCMWHIWEKLSAKVGPVLCGTTDFKKDLSEIVWSDDITCDEFEEKWPLILSRYGVSNHAWLSDIYNIRQDWIPAYYLEEDLSGLMRTTSRSESENHYFNQFCNSRSTLVEFISHFDAAMEAQRYEHRKNDHESRFTEPDIWSNFVLEDQAAQIFTRTIFLDQQLEIDDAISSCGSASRVQVGDFLKFEIEDLMQPRVSVFEVMFRHEDMTISCSCKRFEHFGLLCRHAFYVLRFCGVKEFPKKYVVRRWRKEAVPNSSLRPMSCDGLQENGEDVKHIVRDIRFAVEYSINRLYKDKSQLSLYKDYITAYMAKADEVEVVAPPPSRRDRFAELTGVTKPNNVTIRNPIRTRTKGCGNQKRFKSAREIAIAKSSKTQKACSICGFAGHNQRTCKQRIQSFQNGESTSTSGVTSV